MLRDLQTTQKLCILDAYMSMNFRSILYKNIGFRLHMEKIEKMVVTAYNNLLLSDALSTRKTRIVVPNN